MKHLIAIIILLLLPLSAFPQRRTVKKNIRAAAEEPAESEMHRQMVENTQKIMIIDSVVTRREDILSHIHLGQEAGRLFSCDDFFHTTGCQGIVNENERGNHCFFSNKENGVMDIFAMGKVGDQWGERETLHGLEGLFADKDYPFLMPDGQTLYFAAKGDESLGGYDIFATRFDPETGTWFKPENIGMPFNSESNDYLYVIDEMNGLGWFVSDRNQNGDSVCIYIFIPSATRETYSADEYSEEQIRRLARIASISDTWTDSERRDEHLARLNSLTDTTEKSAVKTFSIVINDKTTYTKASQCLSEAGRELFLRLETLSGQLTSLEKELGKDRDYFARALSGEKHILAPEILQKEQSYRELLSVIRSMEKEIRQVENQ